MEIKEAIKILKYVRDDLHLKSEDCIECFSMAISALEKLEGMELDRDCPCCHSDRIGIWQVGLDDPTKVEYRPDCGQKIDWSDVEVREDD